MSNIYGYIRVSTQNQNDDRQRLALLNFGILEKDIFTDKQSGKDFNRPAYKKLLHKLRADDVLVIKSIDRLGRNYTEILEQWRIITKEKKSAIVVLNMPLLDTRREKDLIASLTIGSLTFLENTYFNSFPIISIAHAEIREYTGTDTAMFDFGENDEKIVNTVKSMARLRAELAAKEKAGVYIKSYSKSINSILSEDEISTITNGIVEVVNVEYKQLPYEAYNVSGQSYGKVGFMYEATVKVKIDTNGISNYLNRNQQDKANLVSQNIMLQQSINNNNNEFEDLSKRSEIANTEQERNNIKSELNKVDKDFLYNQKIEEANRLRYEESSEAIKKYNEAIQINPNKALAYLALGYRYEYMGVIYNIDYYGTTNYDMKYYNMALEKYNLAIKMEPNNHSAYLRRGSLYRSSFKQYDKALDDLNKAIALDYNDSKGYQARGYLYEELKQYDKALDDFNKMLEIDPRNSYGYSNRADLYKELKQYHKAIADYGKAIELTEDKFWKKEYYSKRMNCYKALGDNNGALIECNKLIELEPNDSYHYSERAEIYEELKQYDKAIIDYTKAIEFKPNVKFITNEYLYYRGLAYKHLGNYEAAILDYTKAIEIDPNYAKAYNSRGIIYDNLKNYEKAISDYDKAIEIDPDYSIAYYNRGLAYRYLNDNIKALENFNKYIQLTPNNPDGYNMRGKCYQSLGDNAKAKNDFDKAKELGYNS